MTCQPAIVVLFTDLQLDRVQAHGHGQIYPAPEIPSDLTALVRPPFTSDLTIQTTANAISIAACEVLHKKTGVDGY